MESMLFTTRSSSAPVLMVAPKTAVAGVRGPPPPVPAFVSAAAHDGDGRLFRNAHLLLQDAQDPLGARPARVLHENEGGDPVLLDRHPVELGHLASGRDLHADISSVSMIQRSEEHTSALH